MHIYIIYISNQRIYKEKIYIYIYVCVCVCMCVCVSFKEKN